VGPDDDEVLAPLPPGVAPPIPKQPAGPTVGRRVPTGDRPGSSGDGKAPPPLPPPPVGVGGPPVARDPPPDVIVEVDEVLAPPPVPVAARPKREKRVIPWTPALDGCEVRYDANYVNVAKGKGYPNYTLRCPDPDHGQCFRTHGETETCCAKHGEIEPLAFLQTWAFTEWDPATYASHRLQKVDQKDVDAYALANADALREVVARAKAA